ncbi:MAG: ferrochelatase [Pelagibacterales bacterium]|nr:ferrochelatase [Pelagibacterales bacterium]|tara:strand:+ start:6781 stop:7803 length:1023 start_codon:yes stop_codon:yes gene_type:complete
MKKAVILFNLGGPDSLDAVQPFLFNLFNDPAIISLPAIFRYPLAKFISKRRTPVAKAIYAEMGGRSPILEETQSQADAIEKQLESEKDEYKCFITMRCWNPRASETIKKVKIFNPDQVILLPLYPQYSDATSGSSIKEWIEISKKENLTAETKIICCYPTEKDFILSYSKLIKEKINLNKLNETTLIFSAHGLPENKIKKGDPYQWQVEQSVDELVKKLSIQNLNYILSYQSRVGPLKWIGPSTENIIREEAKKGRTIVVVPVAFVSEHSETLVELDIEYKKLAEENGSKEYIRVPAVTANQDFINSLKSSILLASSGERFTSSIKCHEKLMKCPRIQKL